MGLSHRPEPRNPTARLVLEWAEVAFYIFWLAFTATALVLALTSYGPVIARLLRL